MVCVESTYSREEIRDLCDGVINKFLNGSWVTDELRAERIERLTAYLVVGYDLVYDRIKDVLEGTRKISMTSLYDFEDRVVYALECPFERIPLVINDKTSFNYKNAQTREQVKEVFDIIKYVCQFRLKVGK